MKRETSTKQRSLDKETLETSMNRGSEQYDRDRNTVRPAMKKNSTVEGTK